MGRKLKLDLVSKIFGKLKAIRPVRVAGNGAVWLCVCDCGAFKEVLRCSLTAGRTHSCGCASKGRGRKKNTESLSDHPLWSVWNGMLQRCNNPKAVNYKYYGAKGVKVCEAWLAFKVFAKDIPERPSKEYTLDRIDVTGDYEPDNCRWATWKEQAANKR